MAKANQPPPTPDRLPAPEARSDGDPRVLADQRDALAEVLVDRATRIDLLQAEVTGLKAEMAWLRATRSFRFAHAVSEARHSWCAAVQLPITLWSVAFSEPPGELPLRAVADTAASTADSVAGSSDRAQASSGACLRVAAIVDALSEVALEPECVLLQLDPDDFKAQLDAFRPDLLFVESAWSGFGGRWADRLARIDDALLGVLAHCRRNGVPTVFWNKEDPVHYDHFLPLARHFDFVFTTDAGCEDAYRRKTGRRDIGVLPFACQPRLHHPVAEGERMDAFVFAGSYYRQHARRSSDFDGLAATAAALRPVHIYDRNHERQHPDFIYPERWRDLVLGCVEPSAVPALYRAYRYALNVNTIQDSPTMLARRVFELLACGTPVASNGSLGESTFFPSLTVFAAQPAELTHRLARLVADEPYQQRLRTLGIRQVMSAHTWKHRLDAVCRAVGLSRQVDDEPPALVLARAGSVQEARRLLEMFRSQTYHNVQCLLVSDQSVSDLRSGERMVTPGEAERLGLGGRLVIGWFYRDSYGPNYVTDLMLARRYSNAVAVGKATYFAYTREGTESRGKGLRYHLVDTLACRRSLVAVPVSAQVSACSFVDRLESGFIAGARCDGAVIEFENGAGLLAVDSFNYCEEGHGILPPEADDALR